MRQIKAKNDQWDGMLYTGPHIRLYGWVYTGLKRVIYGHVKGGIRPYKEAKKRGV